MIRFWDKYIRLENIRLIANCNLGIHTSAEDVNRGTEKVQQTVGAYKEIAFRCVWEQLLSEVADPENWLPVKLFLTYPWEQDELREAI